MIADTYSITPTLIGDFRLSYPAFQLRPHGAHGRIRSDATGMARSLNNQVVFRSCPLPNVTGYNGVFSTSGTGSTIIARNDVYSTGAKHDQDLGQPHDEVRRRVPAQHAQLLPAEQSVRELSTSTRS